jgi:hypothetical protein
MNSAVEELTKSIGNNKWILEWKKLEENARRGRGEALMVYNVSHTPGVFQIIVLVFFTPHTMASSITSKETTRSHEN